MILEIGVPIDKHDELLRVISNPLTYISRRALKHFVERRKSEMFTTKDRIEIFNRLYFAIDNLELSILKYDELIVEENDKKIYLKNFGIEIKSSIRIVTERIGDHQEIKSIHFHKNKKTT